jgi:hypothetical protein
VERGIVKGPFGDNDDESEAGSVIPRLGPILVVKS